jgi:phosphatidylglycerol:prolipoprotein diacylglycerol transferase
MNPVAFSIGPLTVHWYGLLIVGGAVLGAWVSTLEARRRGEDPDHVWGLLTWLLIFGIIGARLYHAC